MTVHEINMDTVIVDPITIRFEGVKGEKHYDRINVVLSLLAGIAWIAITGRFPSRRPRDTFAVASYDSAARIVTLKVIG